VRPNGVAVQALEPGISAKNRLKPLTMALIWREFSRIRHGKRIEGQNDELAS
jgi:hypothetical protein